MAEIGYSLSSEEHGARDLVRLARRAEEAGFPFALISDHYHPWIDRQGQSPFVWGVIGGIAVGTERLRLGTGVTCPIGRIHPAVIAQAAATAASMMPGRFFLGLGTGENLNEHILGEKWPQPAVRLEMLEEAIHIIRRLWEGGFKSHRGEHFTVENARLYSLPEEPPPILVAGNGRKAAELAARVADGFIGVAPDPDVVEAFATAGGEGLPRYGQVTVCWAETEEQATKTAHEWWPNAGIKGELSVELPLPRHFEQAAEMVDEEDIAETLACGPDPDLHLEHITRFIDAGYDHVYVHQVGPDQEGFFRFYEESVLPKLG
ncbi:MAG: TIGR03557 family F420-dependent LLM class oxidoreductase [Actinomycetota bacterium]